MFPKTLAFLIISLATQEIVRSVSSQESTASDLDFVSAKCSSKLDFETIEEFYDFMRRFVALDVAAIHAEPLKKCLDHKSALIDLKELIDNYDKKRPCKQSEIVKLENYARKYFLVKKQRPWSLKFFTLFGVNIGLKCKLNLLAHLKQADTEVNLLDFIYSMASPTGWDILIAEHTKRTEEASGSKSIVNRLAKLVPALTLVEQLDFMLFDHPLNNYDSSGKDVQKTGLESSFFELASADTARELRGFLVKIVEACQNLDQLYYNSILSLARLNELGLLVSFKLVDDIHESSLLLHRWLAAASFCQVMARVQVTNNDSKLLELKIIHDDARVESRRTQYSYEAEFDDISEDARQNAWLASVSDGKWLRKDEAMFKLGSNKSVAMNRLLQFIRGLERDYVSWLNKKDQ